MVIFFSSWWQRVCTTLLASQAFTAVHRYVWSSEWCHFNDVKIELMYHIYGENKAAFLSPGRGRGGGGAGRYIKTVMSLL